MLHLGEWVLIFLGVGILFLIILLLVLLGNKKKDENLSKGRKAAIAWLTILTSLSFIGSCLTFTNIIPLSIHVGYYEEVDDRFNHDGNDGGLKITMEREASYSANYNVDSEFHGRPLSRRPNPLVRRQTPPSLD